MIGTRIFNKILFQCNNCNKLLNCSEIYEFLDENISNIRQNHKRNIKEIILEDQFVEDPYEHPIYGCFDYNCPHCNELLKLKIFFSAYNRNTCSFYDINGTKSILPFQVLKGGEVKNLILEFMFWWIHIMKWIDIVSPYIDDFGYVFLGRLPDFIYYYNSRLFINLITRFGRNETKRNGKTIYGKSGKKLIDQFFEEEKCENCISKNPNLSYGDCLECIKLSNHINLKIPNIPRSYFHAKWYAGIKESIVEIIITSHNLTKIGKEQPETVGLLTIDYQEYQKKFLSKLKIK